MLTGGFLSTYKGANIFSFLKGVVFAVVCTFEGKLLLKVDITGFGNSGLLAAGGYLSNSYSKKEEVLDLNESLLLLSSNLFKVVVFFEWEAAIRSRRGLIGTVGVLVFM